VPQEYVDERDELKCFAEAHAVRKDTAEAVARLKPLQRLNEVVIEETNSTDLRQTLAVDQVNQSIMQEIPEIPATSHEH